MSLFLRPSVGFRESATAPSRSGDTTLINTTVNVEATVTTFVKNDPVTHDTQLKDHVYAIEFYAGSELLAVWIYNDKAVRDSDFQSKLVGNASLTPPI